MSQAVSDLQLAKQTNEQDRLDKIKESVGKCYEDLSYTAIHLRREIKFLGDRMSNRTDTGDLTMLPVQINKKATWVNGAKMREEVSQLNKVLGEEDVEEDIKGEKEGEVVKEEDRLNVDEVKEEVKDKEVKDEEVEDEEMKEEEVVDVDMLGDEEVKQEDEEVATDEV
ncbi:DEKNAAC103835 [Brettanomyces naardenensis]|uniref:Mediator of RNA polymerase II transcription subunit 11 n=1 Tax=Brettanomyces naardenensis TaxID=13370 RepID=A0A448YPA3_BRENA|nr:DEKNAAC103835 [Brettanomyces naardenensis]